MFYINEKEKKVRFDYEDPEADNYHLNSSSRGYSRFTSKDLGVEFANLFDLDMEGKHYFLVRDGEIESPRFELLLKV